MEFAYSNARLSLKTLVTIFLLFVGIGYVFGLINIYNHTGMSYTGVVVHYRGDVNELTVPPEFAFAKLINENHFHVFGLSMLFFMIGLLFTFTSLPELPKAVFVAAPFAGMFFDFASLWLTVFSSSLFGWFSIIFGAFMALSFFMLIGRPLYEMWILPLWKRKWNENVPWYLR
ncbi:MAG: hypothetical protein HYZ84_05705 [Candidatus Omnitrophica bacterium]|nr:hypothetical protein [Candidatus Omnitrophota bacterium]